MDFGTISNLLGIIGIAGITATIVNYIFEERKFKREQRIIDLKERIDRFYSPLIFHFENMRSWAVFLRSDKKYAWADRTLAEKIEDMCKIMRDGLRFASRQVEELWYEWQPLAVAVIERESYRKHFDLEEFQKRCERLHEALKSDREEIMKLYDEGIGKEKSEKLSGND